MPNGVNYLLKDKQGKESVIHHNRLKKFQSVDEEDTRGSSNGKRPSKPVKSPPVTYYQLSGDEGFSDSDTDEPDEPNFRRYPQRNRHQRIVEGAVPWDAVDHLV